jgi:polyhydroxyalkanoate synthesis regulator phasin
MANKDVFERYLEAGIAFTNVTRARAEELVQELVQSGEFQRSDARAKVDELIEWTKRGREALVTQVRREVSRQLDALGVTNLEDLAQQVAALLARTAEAGRATATGKKAAAKKAPAKKAAARKTPAKKAAVKKAAVKKAPAKKAPAKKAAGTAAPGDGSAG